MYNDGKDRAEVTSVGKISLKEYAEKHGKHPVTVRQKAQRGGFVTAEKIGRDWLIDPDEPYIDERIKSGNYIKNSDK